MILFISLFSFDLSFLIFLTSCSNFLIYVLSPTFVTLITTLSFLEDTKKEPDIIFSFSL